MKNQCIRRKCASWYECESRFSNRLKVPTCYQERPADEEIEDPAQLQMFEEK